MCCWFSDGKCDMKSCLCECRDFSATVRVLREEHSVKCLCLYDIVEGVARCVSCVQKNIRGYE